MKGEKDTWSSQLIQGKPLINSKPSHDENTQQTKNRRKLPLHHKSHVRKPHS